MFPSYIPSLDVTELPEYDRRSIQEIYGSSDNDNDHNDDVDESEPPGPDSGK